MNANAEEFGFAANVLGKARIGLWAIELVDGEEPRMFADSTMCELLSIDMGLAPEKVYHAWYDNIHHDHYDTVARAVDEMIAGKHSEVQYPWIDPKRGEVFVRCGGVRNMNFARGIRIEGCHQDITDLHHYQNQAHETEMENKFLELVITALPMPVFIKSVDDGRYRICNRMFSDLFGLAQDEVIGRSIMELENDDVARICAERAAETVKARGKPVYFPSVGPDLGFTRNGQVWDKWQSCIDGGDGRQYIVGAMQDVTEFKRAARVKNEFFANVSHDIRTPLNAIVGFSQLLKDEISSLQRCNKYLDSIMFSGETLLDLVNEVLDISKLESGKMVFDRTRCNFAELAGSVLSAVEVKVPENGPKLLLNADSLPTVELDVKHVRQILFNLIGNAVKFTKTGKVAVDVNFTRTDRKKGQLEFSVTDTGIGISEADIKVVFDPFMQGQTKGNYNGTGLGLSICKRLAEAMNGDISVSSTVGVGSVFTVVLNDVPYYDVAVEEKPSVPKSISSEALAEFASSLRVLAVDDVKLNLSVLGAMLSRVGVKDATMVESGERALELLHEQPDGFDLILTDVRMPGMSGTELLAAIRADSALASLPVYAVTADVQVGLSSDDDNGVGFDGYLLKPITVDELVNLLKGLVAK